MVIELKNFDRTKLTKYDVLNGKAERVAEKVIEASELFSRKTNSDTLKSLKLKCVGEESVYNYVHNFETLEEYTDFLDFCKTVTSETLNIKDISDGIALLLFYGCISANLVINNDADELSKRKISRTEFYDILENVFNTVIIDKAKELFNYNITDMSNGITRGEVVYTLFYIVPRCCNVVYNYATNIEEINELISGCFRDEDIHLENVVVVMFDNDTQSFNIKDYLHNLNYSTYISAVLSETAPVGYPIICCYAEMLKTEIVSIEHLGNNCIEDMFKIETYDSIAYMIKEYLTILD